MATKENGNVVEADDVDVAMKTTRRGAGTTSLTKLLAATAMLLMLLTPVYLVYLHARLNKLEQCQCVVDTTRDWDGVVVHDEHGQFNDKVRIRQGRSESFMTHK